MEGYLYDGWNVLMISNLDPANGAHLARKWSCVWRPDVGSRLYARGSWQAAGGVGGLAWLQTGLAQTATMYTYQSVSGNAEVHIPMMDHMGNVRHYYQIKATGSAGPSPATVTGQVTANLDYDAFGREVRATGTKTPASGQPPGLAPGEPWVDNLPFHFSTKFTDRESGLNYYGYRFYDPVDGRWLNRDPIGEQGGVNIYSLGHNDAISHYDYLGLILKYGNVEFEKLVNCWKKTLPPSTDLLKLINKLEKSKDTYMLRSHYNPVGWPYTEANTVGPGATSYIPLADFQLNGVPISFPEAVVHEMGHLEDHADGDGNRGINLIDKSDTKEFLEKMKPLMDEAKKCGSCQFSHFTGVIVKWTETRTKTQFRRAKTHNDKTKNNS